MERLKVVDLSVTSLLPCASQCSLSLDLSPDPNPQEQAPRYPTSVLFQKLSLPRQEVVALKTPSNKSELGSYGVAAAATGQPLGSMEMETVFSFNEVEECGWSGRICTSGETENRISYVVCMLCMLVFGIAM